MIFVRHETKRVVRLRVLFLWPKETKKRNLATQTVSFFSIKYRIEHESSLVHANLLSGLPLELRVEVHGVPVKALDVDARVVGGRQARRVPRRPRSQVGLL